MKLLLQLDLQRIKVCDFQHSYPSKPFQISQDYPRQNFNSVENEAKRKWFLSHFVLNAQSFIRQEWHSFVERHKVNVPFFNWWSILIWWVVLILICWIIYFDEVRWYRNIDLMQRFWSTCRNHYCYMLIKGNYYSTQ